MRANLFLGVFFTVVVNSFAQVDSILLNNGFKSIIKVLSINADDITYKIPTETDGKIYSLRKNEIKKLYLNTPVSQLENPNADVTVEKTAPRQRSAGAQKLLENFELNYAGMNIGQFFFNSVEFNYQRIEKSGIMGVRFTSSFNLAPRDYDIQVKSYNNYSTVYRALYRKFTGGIEMNYFPSGQRKISWYTGPSVQLGVFNYVYSDQACVDSVNNSINYNNGYYTNNHDYSACKRKGKNGINSSVMVNTGLLWRVTPSFFFDTSFGFGAQRVVFGDVRDDVKPKAAFRFLMGYSF